MKAHRSAPGAYRDQRSIAACGLAIASLATHAAPPGADDPVPTALLIPALLIPLLEPDEGAPPAWSAPHQMLPCRDSAVVRLGGAPLPHGQALPLGRALRMRWSLRDCWPFDDRFGLSGAIEMTVTHQGTQLAVHVHPSGLVAMVGGARVELLRDFDGSVSLARGLVRP